MKATQEEQQIRYEQVPIRLPAEFSAETLQNRKESQDTFKVKTGKKPKNKNTLYHKALIQRWQRNQKLYREAKDQRIQHHQTNFRTNAKGTSIGKEKKKKEVRTRNKKITNCKAGKETHTVTVGNQQTNMIPK